MALTRKIRDLIKLPKVTPEGIAVWVCLGVVGVALLEELARWLSHP